MEAVLKSIVVLLKVYLAHGWNDAYEEKDDQTVLTVFLPILGVAIIACAGGCCYMEKKRKERILSGVSVDTDDDTTDAESVISTSTVRSRPFLLPSVTTGHVSRSGSRAGSIKKYRNEFPPAYSSGQNEINEKTENFHEDEEISFYGGSNFKARSQSSDHSYNRNSQRKRRPSSGYGGSPDSQEQNFEASSGRRASIGYNNQALSRSASMVNIRPSSRRSSKTYSEQQSDKLRRSQSVFDFTDEEVANNNYRPQKASSQWSVRTAPQMKAVSNASSGSSTGGRPRSFYKSNLKRSMSQPNLRQSRTNMTYPNGILKRTTSSGYLGEEGNNSNDSGARDLYYDRYNSREEKASVRSHPNYHSKTQEYQSHYDHHHHLGYNSQVPQDYYEFEPHHPHLHAYQHNSTYNNVYGSIPSYHHKNRRHHQMSQYYPPPTHSSVHSSQQRGYPITMNNYSADYYRNANSYQQRDGQGRNSSFAGGYHHRKGDHQRNPQRDQHQAPPQDVYDIYHQGSVY